jgi:hypothetical protein
LPAVVAALGDVVWQPNCHDAGYPWHVPSIPPGPNLSRNMGSVGLLKKP